MKRIGWTAMLLGVTLMVTGCANDNVDAPDKAADSQEESADAKPPQPPSPGGDGVPPAPSPSLDPDPTGQPSSPSGDAGKIEGGSKVANALFRAMKTSLAGDSDKPDDPGEAPKFQP